MEAMDELGRPDAAPGTREWAIWHTGLGVNAYHSAQSSVYSVSGNIGPIKRRKAYLLMPRADGSCFESWEEFCNTRRPFGLGIPVEVVDAILDEPDGDKKVATVKAEVQARSGDRVRAAASADDVGDVLPRGQPKKEMTNLVNSSRPARAAQSGVGRTQQQKLDALARHAPELLEQVKEGRMSAHAAALEAGVVKAPCPVRAAQRAVKKMDEDQLAAFREWFTEYAERNDT